MDDKGGEVIGKEEDGEGKDYRFFNVKVVPLCSPCVY